MFVCVCVCLCMYVCFCVRAIVCVCVWCCVCAALFQFGSVRIGSYRSGSARPSPARPGQVGPSQLGLVRGSVGLGLVWLVWAQFGSVRLSLTLPRSVRFAPFRSVPFCAALFCPVPFVRSVVHPFRHPLVPSFVALSVPSFVHSFVRAMALVCACEREHARAALLV